MEPNVIDLRNAEVTQHEGLKTRGELGKGSWLKKQMRVRWGRLILAGLTIYATACIGSMVVKAKTPCTTAQCTDILNNSIN